MIRNDRLAELSYRLLERYKRQSSLLTHVITRSCMDDGLI